MKKHDEGYALVLVLVVLAVLSLVVASVLSVSLKNLQSQQSAVERMQDKYAAQGQMEIVEAKLIYKVGVLRAQAKTYVELTEARSDVENVLKDVVGESEIEWDESGTTCKFETSKTDEAGIVKIECTIVINNVICKKSQSYYIIGIPEITYEAYTVTTVSSTETDGGEPQ